MTPREHRAVELPLQLPPLMALPLPDHVDVELDGLRGVLEYYEYRAEEYLREERRRAWVGDVDWPEWEDEQLSQEKAERVLR